jgi:hypothetical protein
VDQLERVGGNIGGEMALGPAAAMTPTHTDQIELSAGTVEYVDSGGDGPTVVMLHGLMMDVSLWDDVIADLESD